MSIRGLPDERPRPSVANLIGRFEQRASKHPPSVGPPGGPASASPTASPSQSRSTSVVSHVTGDAAAIEVKERREWPPQQFKNNNNSTGFGNVTNGSGNGNGNAVEGLPAGSVNAPSSTTTTFSVAELRRSLEKSAIDDSMRDIVKSPPPDTSSDLQAVPLVSVPDEAKPQAEVASPPPAPAISEPAPVVEEVKSDTGKKASTSPVRAAGKVATSKSTNSRSTGGAAGKTATTPRPSAITQSKSTSSAPQATKTSTAAPPATKPLTAQRTGNSTASAAAARAGAKSPPVSNPSRAKTPTARGLRASSSGPHLKAGTDRAKTPTVSPARAKTPTASSSLSASAVKHAPSSGLYAPTKASLARARNAETPPPPVPKPAVSASSLERLMKPTAASASKVRGPAPTSPPRAPPKKATPASPPSSSSGTRKVMKPRVGLAPARMKEERERKEKAAAKKTTATRAGAAAAVTATGAAIAAQSASEDEHEHGQEQPSFISTTSVSDASQALSHEEHEPGHTGPPSDIESYDDAFASDDERAMELDRAHLVTSARPSTEGEQEPFAAVGTPEPTASFTEVGEVKNDELEHEAAPAAPAEEAEEAVPHSEPEPESLSEQPTPESAPVESKAEVDAAPAAEDHSVSTPKQNGFSASEPNATTEFDNVLDMLAVKPPPRAASPGDIPDEEL